MVPAADCPFTTATPQLCPPAMLDSVSVTAEALIGMYTVFEPAVQSTSMLVVVAGLACATNMEPLPSENRVKGEVVAKPSAVSMDELPVPQSVKLKSCEVEEACIPIWNHGTVVVALVVVPKFREVFHGQLGEVKASVPPSAAEAEPDTMPV